MYLNYDAPDYLIEDHPGEEKVPCKPLIMKVKADTGGIGLTKDQCVHEAEQYFNEICKKRLRVCSIRRRNKGGGVYF